MTVPFQRAGIVGLGLIGGSIALGLRRRWPSLHVIGVDRPEISADARRRGVVSDTRASIADLREVDVIVLAAPVPQIMALLQDAHDAGVTATITDVGSTKRHIVAAAARCALRFVGGHPVAGAAQGGLDRARADLFEGREWLIVPGTAAAADVHRVDALVRGLGAAPRLVDADVHDRVMAYVSHLPQLLASTLMTVAGDAVGRDGLAAAGQGFADMTRLASSPADVWRGILATNADYLSEAVRAMVAALPADARALADPAAVDALFATANKWCNRT